MLKHLEYSILNYDDVLAKHSAPVQEAELWNYLVKIHKYVFRKAGVCQECF
jgi:hypothetical protein